MVSDRRLSRARVATALAGTAVAVGALVVYPTSSGRSGPSATVLPVQPAGTVSGSSSGSGTTYTGSVVQTRWGPVQVAITVSNGRIVSASAVQVPHDNSHDAEVNGYAVPVLNAETVRAQSAQIDTVSGATVTSGGYVGSLQAALDAAHL